MLRKREATTHYQFLADVKFSSRCLVYRAYLHLRKFSIYLAFKLQPDSGAGGCKIYQITFLFDVASIDHWVEKSKYDCLLSPFSHTWLNMQINANYSKNAIHQFQLKLIFKQMKNYVIDVISLGKLFSILPNLSKFLANFLALDQIIFSLGQENRKEQNIIMINCVELVSKSLT